MLNDILEIFRNSGKKTIVDVFGGSGKVLLNAEAKEEDMAVKKFQNNIDYEALIHFKPSKVNKIYIIGQTKGQNEIKMPKDVEHISLGPFIKEIYNELPSDIIKEIVPETYPLLRTIQLYKWASPEK